MDHDMCPSERSQNVALAMVVFGTVALLVGCWFKFSELSTSAAGITGAGINMLTTQFRAFPKSGIIAGDGDDTK